MSEQTPAPFGRPRELPEAGLVRLQVRVPARLARLVYAQSGAERRHLGSVIAGALDEYYKRHPVESWSAME